MIIVDIPLPIAYTKYMPDLINEYYVEKVREMPTKDRKELADKMNLVYITMYGKLSGLSRFTPKQRSIIDEFLNAEKACA